LSAVSPALAAAAAEYLFVTPMRANSPMREAGWAATAERLTLPSPHGELSAWVWGRGPRTVLLVHGWSGRGLQLGAFAAPLVLNGYRVVTFDAPAHGVSPGGRSNLFRHTDGVLAAARAFGPLSGVIAHSLGTTSVLLAANRNALSPGRLVALAPMARTRTMTDWYGRMTGFSPVVVERMRALLERRFDFAWDDIEPRSLAKGLASETLIIHDRDDRELPASEGRELARRILSAKLLVTSGLGHRRILRDAEVVAAATRFIIGNLDSGSGRPVPESKTSYAA
jgi:pimeloyl-ACP methyl ester carboxylesterase